MSSKVLIESSSDRARPFAWRTVAATGETVDRRRTALESALGEVRPPAATTRGNSLEARLTEMEEAMEERVREAHEAGSREGEAASKVQAEEQVQAALERLAKSIAGIEEYRSRLYRQTEVDAVRLSVAIARRVLRRELTVDPSAIEGLVSAALQRLQTQESCRVRMHPDHLPALRAAIERQGMSAKVEVIADAAQEPGAALFEMARGNLDASMDSQLREIERGLVDRFQLP
jgi:flagellar assembly protein FliH